MHTRRELHSRHPIAQLLNIFLENQYFVQNTFNNVGLGTKDSTNTYLNVTFNLKGTFETTNQTAFAYEKYIYEKYGW
jgi:hypothetical protein